MPSTRFYGSQIGGPNLKPHVYTGSPLELLRHDILTAFRFITYLPYIVWPIQPFGSGELCELYPSKANLWAIFLHVILVILQLPFILSIPFWLLFPLWSVVLGVCGFMVINKGICYLLNGSRMEFHSTPAFAEVKKEHEHEQWIFLNGVAVGKHWLQSNVDRLALTFGRPVLGVHNKTEGILFDVIQCLIQRNFTYATPDVRACYTIIKSQLYQPHLTKVIFILHSQGGIEGGLIIDWLLQEVPQDLLSKLEVYTFGNAANHFNNPHLHLLSQTAALKNPERPSTTKTVTQVHYHEPVLPTPLASLDPSSPTTPRPRTSTHKIPSGKTLRYIEHYAHTKDFVSQWGVLHFTSLSLISSPLTPRFMGRVFERQGRGHQMNQHYLDNMFPLKRSIDNNGGIAGSGFVGVDVDVEGGFMDSILDLTPESPPASEHTPLLANTDLSSPSNNDTNEATNCDEREGIETSYLGAHGESIIESASASASASVSQSQDPEVILRDMSPNSTFNILGTGFSNNNADTGRGVVAEGEGNEMRFKVRDLSRLWLYVNGGSPRADEVDFSIARMATI